MLDTDVAIHLRNRNRHVLEWAEEFDSVPFLSVVSQVEMEGGVYAKPRFTAERRLTLDTLLEAVTVLPFDEHTALAYRRIVAATGYSRRKIADRMIAATAIVHSLTLVTMNASDFSGIPSLEFTVWPWPAD